MNSGDTVAIHNGERLTQRRKKKSLGAVQSKNGKVLFLLAIPVIAYVILFAYVPMWGLGYAFVEFRL